MSNSRIDYQLVVAYLLLVSGVILISWLGLALMNAYSTHQWPQTKGLIYESEINFTTSGLSKKENGFYKLQLRYQYKVDNKTYSNSHIYLTDLPFLSLEQAEELAGEYSTGSLHTVRYNPEFPVEAILKAGVSNLLIGLFAPAILFLGISIGTIRRRNKTRQNKTNSL